MLLQVLHLGDMRFVERDTSEGTEAVLSEEPEEGASEPGEVDVLAVLRPLVASAVFGAVLLAFALWQHRREHTQSPHCNLISGDF